MTQLRIKINGLIEITAIPYQKEDNSWIAIVCFKDITELSEKEKISLIYSDIMNNHSIISRTGLEGNITYVNSKFEDISGYKLSEVIGKKISLLDSGEHSKEFFKNMWETICSGKIWRGEFKNKKKNGECYWVDSTIVPRKDGYGKIVEYISFNLDITEKKEKEYIIKKQSKKLREIYSQSQSAITTFSVKDNRFTSANPAALNMFGIKTEEEFVKLNPESLSPVLQENGELSSELAKKYIEQAMNTGRASFDWIHCTLDGEIIDCKISLSRIETEEGEAYVQSIIDNVSVQKQLEREIKERNNQKLKELDSILSSTPSCLKIISKNGELIDMNNKGLDLIEADSLESVLGANVYDIVEESDTLIFQIVGLKGNVRWMETYAAPYCLDSGEVVHIAITNEITDKIRKEEELLEQKKMATHNAKLATIGEMAAGIGHEINNPLAVINGNISIIEKLMNGDDCNKEEVSKRLYNIKKASGRVEGIVKGLRSFSRKDDDTNKVFDFSELMRDSILMVKELYSLEGIVLDDYIEKDLLFNGNRGQIQQVIMNLLKNAKDAMDGKTIKNLTVNIKKKDDYLELSVEDTGCGIPDSIKDKIFNPFFTTKDVNRGTGIGLSLCNNFIKENNGHLILKSKENEGTEFLIKFPYEADLRLEADVDEESRFNGEIKVKKILIVDDEEGIRDILDEMFSEYDLDLLFAENGKEALSIYENHKDIDMIVSDMQMPKLNGLGLLKELRNNSLYNGKFYFITGGVNLNLEELESGIDGVFSKPFDEEEIKKSLFN